MKVMVTAGRIRGRRIVWFAVRGDYARRQAAAWALRPGCGGRA